MQKNYSLKTKHTFQLTATADYFFQYSNITDLQELMSQSQWKNLPHRILGSGSNTIFIQNFKGLVIQPNNQGIEYLSQTNKHVDLLIQAATNWDDCVNFCVNKGYSGIENLSAIPGTVGAAPVQNIGAYGAQLSDVFIYLDAINLKTGQIKRFTKKQCQFGYRNSLFKHNQTHIITAVCLRLKRDFQPNFHYKALLDYFNKTKQKPTLAIIRKAVIDIRQSKLPNPMQLPNAGSFFKNPTISAHHHQTLEQQFPNLPAHPVDKAFKVPAAWLIEQCGLKAYLDHGIGIDKTHALVLVNHGNGSAEALLRTIKFIRKKVFDCFSIELETEVELV